MSAETTLHLTSRYGPNLLQRVLCWLGLASPPPEAPVAPLTTADMARLRLPWSSRFEPEEFREHLEQHPPLAWWVPGTNHYAIGGYWQGRSDIGQVLEVMGGRYQALLVDRLLTAMRQVGIRLVLLSQDEEGRALKFYKSLGWIPLEEVIIYRRSRQAIPVLPRRLTMLTLTPERGPALLDLEMAAFPWLWRYGYSVFQAAAITPNRRLCLGYLGNDLVGYFIYTMHQDFGHLDRLAVHPYHQGHGYGAELLAFALQDMANRGATSFGLSTQRDNRRSQRLYEGFGFRRTGERYYIYGKWLTAKEE